MRKEYDYAAIFSAEDVRNDFAGCIATAMVECDEATILVEGRQGICRIAEISSVHKSAKSELRLQIHEEVARQYGIDAETTEASLNVAEIIRNNVPISIEEAVKIVTDITENYNISHK